MEQKKSKYSSVEPGADEVWTAGGPIWINLVNTIALESKGMIDVVGSAESFLCWTKLAGLQPPGLVTSRDVEFVATLRELFVRVMVAMETDTPVADQDTATLNSILRKQHEWIEIYWTQSGSFERTLHRATETIEQAMGPAVNSLSEMLINGDRTRLRTCAHPDCQLRFYDDSKNGSRRWCTMSLCGNRAKAAAYLRRQKAGT